jgi:cytochrome c oxidase subunit IV
MIHDAQMIGYVRLFSKIFTSLIAITLIMAAGMIITVDVKSAWLASDWRLEGEWLTVYKLRTDKL